MRNSDFANVIWFVILQGAELEKKGKQNQQQHEWGRQVSESLLRRGLSTLGKRKVFAKFSSHPLPIT